MTMQNVIAAVTAAPLPKATAALAPSAAAQGSSADFGALLHDAVANVQDLEMQASTSVQGLMRGDGVDIHTAMIATQKADLAFELALSVRNKAIGAYQTMMGLQF
jgi:flagellar hook-basal body complex protein FliE